ncbi:MAG: sigma-70 family RNA polymerase sigma factor [Lentisphaerae bacterium]|nr:sigma-70 family RNA polymerase sigma factor [Lentisphaerota bacterium]MBT4815874.1 sigma-70 family RNA polymerase sigma factor [Lentisphaerota bacterium]MBT5611149.1 sigma-70 family RNA polymerase sigma factor [Lentisphaerota bacterium]MBT7054727.1 sigma-70 family RNA polymerase sigma factor [Lentisphaerota bacterium]MBT7841985.1 sigma-70 family RNA polymerase sigma factor [Lentisphaerota bacterium]
MTTTDGHNSEDLSTPRLVELVCSGRVECFEEIVRRYQQDVLRVINAMLFDRSSAEELVQRVFVNAYQSLGTFRRDRDFGPWIRTIARNAAREEFRRNARYARRLGTYRDLVVTDWCSDRRADRRHDALHEALDECVSKLPERTRGVLDLRYRHGHDFEHIAEALDTTPGAMRNLLCRVRERLRRCIRQQTARQ